MWISKAHLAAIEQHRTEMFGVFGRMVEDRDARMATLEARVTQLEADNKALVDKLLAREDDRRKPMEPLPEPEPDTWEERMRKEIAAQETADGKPHD